MTSTPGYLRDTNASKYRYFYVNQEQDLLRDAFTSGTHTGLRSRIPARLQPHFGLQERNSVVMKNREAKVQRSLNSTATSSSSSGPRSRPRRYKSKSATFSQPEYMESEYGLERKLQHQQYLDGKAKWLGKQLAAYQPPKPIHGVPTFGKMTYVEDPYETKELQLHFSQLLEAEALRSKKSMDGTRSLPFVQGGNHDQDSSRLRGQLPELCSATEMIIAADWPHLYVQVNPLEDGCVGIAFIGSATVLKLDGLRLYMNTFIRENTLSSEFRLRRDTARWPTITEHEQHALRSVEYVCVPPWVKLSPATTYFKLHAEERKYNGPRVKRTDFAALSLRVPFAHTTAAGVAILTSPRLRYDENAQAPLFSAPSSPVLVSTQPIASTSPPPPQSPSFSPSRKKLGLNDVIASVDSSPIPTSPSPYQQYPNKTQQRVNSRVPARRPSSTHSNKSLPLLYDSSDSDP